MERSNLSKCLLDGVLAHAQTHMLVISTELNVKQNATEHGFNDPNEMSGRKKEYETWGSEFHTMTNEHVVIHTG